MERLARNTGVRLTLDQLEKADRLAQSLGTTRNRLFGMLIDTAEVQSKPVVSVGLKNNRRDAQNLTETSITAIRA
jgi:hypothetical protein